MRPCASRRCAGPSAWSYDLLEEDEKTLFGRLRQSLLAAARWRRPEASCNSNRDLGEDVLDGVAQLIDKSLLRQEVAGRW